LVPESWIEKYPDHQGGFGLYPISLYYVVVTLSTVGYGDIYPRNNLERICAMVTMLFGIIFYSNIVAQLGAALADDSSAIQLEIKKKQGDLAIFKRATDGRFPTIYKMLEHKWKLTAHQRANGLQKLEGWLFWEDIPPSMQCTIAVKLHTHILRSDFFRPLTKKLDEAQLEETEFFIGELLAKFSSEHFKPNDIAVVQNLDPKYIFVVTDGEFVARTIFSESRDSQTSSNYRGSKIILAGKNANANGLNRTYTGPCPTTGIKVTNNLENSRVNTSPFNNEDGQDIRTSGSIVKTYFPGNIFGHIPDQLDSMKEEYLSPVTVICKKRGTVAKIATEAAREVFRASGTGRLLCDALREERTAAGYRHPRQFGGKRVSVEERLRGLEAVNTQMLQLLTALAEKKPLIAGRALSLPQHLTTVDSTENPNEGCSADNYQQATIREATPTPEPAVFESMTTKQKLEAIGEQAKDTPRERTMKSIMQQTQSDEKLSTSQ